ncbi:helix-turn-helix domain-containing protein [Kitasatospora griseola]|uniref:helix-turn-helix domain-containing protein n=1 Tax=Kitasatospora griseola TaxID=2064 RepID=UPI0016711E5A|nr:helix-turn-helix domain-containing protein [Kitasatospora griseola]GGR03845.1 LuxR family transcriptional regulator [Kitasatospora griseola]
MADPAPAPVGDLAQCLYLEILDAGGRIAAERIADPQRPALAELLRAGLLISDGLDGAYLAVDPRLVAESLGTEMNTEAARLLNRAECLPGRLDPLITAYENVRHPIEPAACDVQVIGREQVRRRIAQLAADCCEETLTAQPGELLPSVLETSLHQELPMLRRGCRIRTLYRPGVLAEPSAIRYAAALTEAGGEVRLLDEPFQRALVFDRAAAVVPAAEDHSRAALILDPATVATIVAGFERDWARAERVRWDLLLDTAPARTAADRVGRLLAQGLTQRAVAARLGLSERTVAGHISRLREQHGADTLFQLGWLMRGGEDRD